MVKVLLISKSYYASTLLVTLKPPKISATYGTVMIGAYLQGSINIASAYYFYDNSSASSYVTGTLNPVSGGGFLYTDGSKFLEKF